MKKALAARRSSVKRRGRELVSWLSNREIIGSGVVDYAQLSAFLFSPSFFKLDLAVIIICLPPVRACPQCSHTGTDKVLDVFPQNDKVFRVSRSFIIPYVLLRI